MKTENVAISVIIPTYKHRDFVLQTIASVQEQTFTDWELIIINDGSPDDTHEILQPILNTPKIRYIRQENQGQSAARNRGIAEARGRYLAFLDDDDLWPADKLAWQVAVLDEHPEWGFVSGTYTELGRSDGITKPPYAPKTLTHLELFSGCPCISPGQYLVRTDLIKKVGGFDTQLWGTDDYDLLLRISVDTPIIIDKRLALYYRVHPGNASNNSLRMYQNTLRAFDKNLAQLPVSERKTTRKISYEILYIYYGVPLLWLWHKELRQGHLLKSLRVIGAIIGMCGKFLFCYPQKLPTIIRDFIPPSIRLRATQNRK